MDVDSLNDELKSYLEVYFEEERGKGRLPGLHPSEISDEHFCFRKDKLHQINKEYKLGWKYSLETQMIFEAGHSAHEYIRNEWLGPWGKLIGKWTKPGEETIYGTQPDTSWRFEEEAISIPNPFDSSNNIVGHIDGILDIDGEKYILDIKTIYIKAFYATKSVNEKYKNQLHFYMKALDIKKALILYICKTDYQPKFLEVTYSEDRYQDLLKRGEEVIKSRNTDELPDKHPKCTKSSSMRKMCMFNCACQHIENLNDFKNSPPVEWHIKKDLEKIDESNKLNTKYNSLFL